MGARPAATVTASATASVLALALAALALLPEGARAASAPTLADLRAGGFVIFVRHATIDPATADGDGPAVADCAAARILTAAGQDEARAIGEAVRRLGIPIGDVVTSPWCRCRDTAHLAFGRADVDPMLASIHGAEGDQALRARLAAALRERLARRPAPGTNTVIVGHGFNLAAAARIPLAQGEAAFFRPLAERGFELAGKVGAREWVDRLP